MAVEKGKLYIVKHFVSCERVDVNILTIINSILNEIFKINFFSYNSILQLNEIQLFNFL